MTTSLLARGLFTSAMGIVIACSSAEPNGAQGSVGGTNALPGAGSGGKGGGGTIAGSGGSSAGGVPGGTSNAGDSGDGNAAGDAGSAGAGDPLPQPWTDQSDHIELLCGSFFEGSLGFRADRATLSAQQLQILAALTGLANNEVCSEDELRCEVSIRDAAGQTVSYVSDEADALCNSSEPGLAFQPLIPFLNTLDCLYGKGDGQIPLPPDSRCLQGLFTPSGGTTIERTLDLQEPGRSYHVELNHCAGSNQAGQVSMQLLSSTSQVIATGTPVATPGPDGACLALDATVTVAGEAKLSVTTTAAFSPAGDFFFRFY